MKTCPSEQLPNCETTVALPKLSVIMPAYNEGETIGEVLDRVRAVPLDLEIIIVDDGSTDATRAALAKYEIDPRIRVFTHDGNRGKGAAIRTGIAHVRGGIVLIQDADLEYDPEDYPALLAPFQNPDVQVVYGSRRLLKSNQRGSFQFLMGGITLTWITNLLYGTHITDEPTCYKAFRAGLLKKLPLKCTRFEFCPEVTALVAKRHIPIREIPIRYYPRTTTEGKKIGLRDWFEAVVTLLKYRWKR